MSDNIKLDKIESAFKYVEQVGINGAEMSDALRIITKKIDWIVAAFDAGSQDPVWIGNFATFAGQDSVDYAIGAYTILKDTQAELKALG